MKRTLSFLLILFVSIQSLFAQDIESSENPIIATQEVTFTIDVTGNNTLEGLTEAWAWVWVPEGPGAATNISPADASADAAKWTNLGENKWEITFIPTNFIGATADEITQLGIIFKGNDWADGQTGDFIFDVIKEGGLSVSIDEPVLGDIIDQYTTQKISISSTISAKLQILVNGSVAKSAENVTTLSYDYFASTNGALEIEAVAMADELADTASIKLYIKPNTIVAGNRPSYATQLGPNYNGSEVTLVLQDPAKKKEFIYLIGDFNDWTPTSGSLMTLEEGATSEDPNYWWITIDTLNVDEEYIYQYLIDGSIKIADPYTEKVSDPDDKYINQGHERYPNLIEYPSSKTDKRASVLQINQPSYTWVNNNFTPVPLEDVVVYEMHIRDFVATDTYEEAIQKLDYIQGIGVNTIHLMPVNEFEGNDSWGYNPNFYFAPDKYYGPKTKLMEFIDKAHGKGIAVVIDLVLNHSFHSSPMVRMYNTDGQYGDPSADNPWFNEQSNFTNPGLQWGADFNHESKYTQALVDSVNAHWMQYYHVDGFRFDFTKGFGNNLKDGADEWGSNYDADRVRLLKRMNDEIHKRNPNAYVIFEHLAENKEEVELAKEGISMWGNMNHDFRDIVKGGNKNIAWQSPKERGMPIHGVMSYMESHDEERLIYDSENNGTKVQTYNLKEIQNGVDREKLAAAFFFMVPGPKLIWQFGEVGYNVSINQKEYQGEVSGDHRTSRKPLIAEFDTENNAIRQQLYDTYAALLKLRTDEDLSSLVDSDYSYSLDGLVKTISLNGTNIKVKIIGNFDLLPLEEYTYDFSSDANTWYSYFENGKEYDASGSITLNPSEFIVLVDKVVEFPSGNLVTGFVPMVEVTPYGFTENEEIKIYFDPSQSDKEFGTTITLNAGVVLDKHGSGNVSNENSIVMTQEGGKYVASFTTTTFLNLEENDIPYELALTFSDQNGISEGPVFVDFEANNAKLFIIGDILNVDWKPENAIEMLPDGNGGFYSESLKLTSGKIFKFIDERSFNGGEWGFASEGVLKPTSGPGNDIPVSTSGTFIIKANINDLTYSIDAVTSIEDTELSKSVLAFPNPTTSHVNLVGTELQGNIKYQLRDNSGRVILLGEALLNGSLKLDLDHIADGMYYLELNTANGRIVKKIMKR